MSALEECSAEGELFNGANLREQMHLYQQKGDIINLVSLAYYNWGVLGIGLLRC